jgi:hypothetical protein
MLFTDETKNIIMRNLHLYNKLYEYGKENIKDKKIVFCGMVRDCGTEIKNNIPTIEKIGAYFQDYRVVVFENNSIDTTKDVLTKWKGDNGKVFAECNDFDESKYKNIPKEKSYYLPNSRRRIQRYIDYRNLYMEYLDKMEFDYDFVALIDYDIAKIDIKGFISSFGTELEWDAITANGYSLSPKLKRRYHDTYALCEAGKENRPQTEEDILTNRDNFAFLRKGMPFIRTFSAYGGIAIFRGDILNGIRYKIIMNNYDGVEVRCEHFSVFKQLFEKGHDKVYINPNMEVYYQRITLNLIIKKIKDLINRY